MTDLGFKRITIDNWLEPDGVTSAFVYISPEDGQPIPKNGDDWVREILEFSLDETVPQEVHALYEVARGAMAYGYFFYPMFTFAEGQLYRVAEAAVTHKCKTMGAPDNTITFKQKVDFLAGSKVLTNREKEIWHSIRRLRNAFSHPRRQYISTPPMAINTLGRIAEEINSLFSHE